MLEVINNIANSIGILNAIGGIAIGMMTWFIPGFKDSLVALLLGIIALYAINRSDELKFQRDYKCPPAITEIKGGN